MHERAAEQARQDQKAFDAYVDDRVKATSTSNADELTKLVQLKDSGAITEGEYEAEKAKILA
jgi:hypothetical protein